MRLYDCKEAPNPRRVRIFLKEKRLSIEHIEINIRAGDNLKPAFLAVNPRGLIPTLELDDGTLIDEVVAICRYIEEMHPTPVLMGTDAKSKALIESRNRHVEIDGINAMTDAFRNSVPIFAKRAIQGVVEETLAIPELCQRGHAGITRFYDALNKYLSTHEFVAGSQFSIADISALCAVDFAAWIKRSIPEEHEHTQRWYAAVSARESSRA